VIRGTKQHPRVTGSSESVSIQFVTPVTLATPIVPEAELMSGDLRETTLTLRLVPGTEVASSYPLDNPPRFVIRLGAAEPAAPVAAPRAESLVVIDPDTGRRPGCQGPATNSRRVSRSRLPAPRPRDSRASGCSRAHARGRRHRLAFRSNRPRQSLARGCVPLHPCQRLLGSRRPRRRDLLHERGRLRRAGGAGGGARKRLGTGRQR